MKNILVFGCEKKLSRSLVSFLLQKGYHLGLVAGVKEKTKDLLSLPLSFIEKEKWMDEVDKFDCIINFTEGELDVGSEVYLINIVDLEKSMNVKEKVTNIFIPFVLTRKSKIIDHFKKLYRFFLGFTVFNKSAKFPWIHEDDFYELVLKLIEEEEKPSELNAISNYTSYKSFFSSLSLYTERRSLFHFPLSFIYLLCRTTNELSFFKHSTANLTCLENVRFSCIDSALKDILCFLKTPTLSKASFHYVYEREQFIESQLSDVFNFFSNAKNLEQITPSHLKFKILTQSSSQIEEGTEFTYRLQLNGVPFNWKTIISGWNMPQSFTDYQKRGPYEVWFHTHEFYPCKGGVLMRDTVLYRLPLGFLGDLFGLYFVVKNITKIFDYRFNKVDLLFERGVK